MTEKMETGEMRLIPIDLIDVLNPRERNKNVFDEIVANIKAIGLKKPITVTPRAGPDGTERYLLICGEGRMKAFRSLGEQTIPALVVTVSDENAFIMSLTENIARRQYRPLELLAGIEQLRDQGYEKKVIAQKTGLTVEYVNGILTLLKNGEERLLVAVERGRIPLNAALTIAGAGDDDKDVQSALQDAYESGKLRGKQLIQARRVIESRLTLGRSVARGTPMAKLHKHRIDKPLRQRDIRRSLQHQTKTIMFADCDHQFGARVNQVQHSIAQAVCTGSRRCTGRDLQCSQ